MVVVIVLLGPINVILVILNINAVLYYLLDAAELVVAMPVQLYLTVIHDFYKTGRSAISTQSNDIAQYFQEMFIQSHSRLSLSVPVESSNTIPISD